jgi:hypothetical protein
MAARSSITHSTKGRRRHRPIIIVGGDKGGVGKSFIGRTIVGWLTIHGHKVCGFDGDARNPHLDRYYSASMPVTRPPLRSVDGWSEMYQAWEEANPTEVLVVDLPGNIGDMVEAEATRLSRVAAALDRTIINVWVGSEEEDSIWLLQRIRSLAAAPFTLFVMNGRFGADVSRFELWQTSKTRTQFILDGGAETLLPALPIHPRTKIIQSRSPFHDTAAAGFTLTDKVDFDMWWERVEHALQPLASMMEAA